MKVQIELLSLRCAHYLLEHPMAKLSTATDLARKIQSLRTEYIACFSCTGVYATARSMNSGSLEVWFNAASASRMARKSSLK